MDSGLRQLLAHYAATVQPLAPPAPLGNAGGLSGASLWRFPSGRGLLIARRWPAEGPGPHELARMHDWLAMARHLGYIPAPLAGSDGRTFYETSEGLCELSPWLE